MMIETWRGGVDLNGNNSVRCLQQYFVIVVRKNTFKPKIETLIAWNKTQPHSAIYIIQVTCLNINEMSTTMVTTALTYTWFVIVYVIFKNQ